MRTAPRSGRAFGAFLAVTGAVLAVDAMAPSPCMAAERRVDVEVSRSADALDCPDRAALGAAVAHLVEREQPGATPEQASALRFDVSFAREDSRYVATVRPGSSPAGERRILDDGPTCAALAEAVAVTIAVLYDGARTQSPPPAPPAAAFPAPPVTPAAARALGAPDLDDIPPSEPMAPSRSRSRIARSNLFFELLGNGVIYSINYEYRLGDGRTSLRAGFGALPLSDPFPNLPGRHVSTVAVSFPLLANYYVGRGSHRLELGIGLLLGNFGDSTWFLSGTGLVGYRYMPDAGGFTFGAGFTPILYSDARPFQSLARTTWGLAPLAGVSCGFGF